MLEMFIITNYVLLMSVVCLTREGGVINGMITAEFQIYQNKSPAAPVVIGSTAVVSLVECASLCTENLQCNSFSVNCLNLQSPKRVCQQQSSLVSSDLELLTSDLCYAEKTEVSWRPVPSTTAATDTSATQVIDIVYGPRDMCPGGSTNADFLLLTSSGVYVYDEITDLTNSPCIGPVTISSVFNNYPSSSIPTIDMVSGLLLYQTSTVELYADGTVYKWQIESGLLNTVLGFDSYSDHLGTTDLNNVDFKWAAHRLGSSAERHFYLGDDLFFLKSSQHGTRSFTKSEKVADMNGFDMNPWSGIPTDTVAVTGYGNEPNRNFALVDSSGKVYTYQLDHTSDNNNPTKTLTQHGDIHF